MERRDWIGKLGFWLVLASIALTWYVTASRTYFYYDELFGVTFASAPSPITAVRAIAHGADTAPPLYFILNWFWVRLFGTSELAVRSFAGLGFLVAAVVLWRTLRRYFPPRAVALGLLTALCASTTAADAIPEARYYGMLTALVAVAIALALDADERPTLSWGFLAVTALVHTALVYTHVYGPIYSGAILLAIVITDRLRGRFRPRLYASIVVAWIAFLAWLPAIRHQGDLAKPHWVFKRPVITDLLATYLYGAALLPIVILVVIGLLAAARPAPPPESERRPTAVLVMAYALLAVPIIAFVASRVIVPIFSPHYFIPSAIGWAILLAFLAAPAERAHVRWSAPVWIVLFVVLAAKPVVHALTDPPGERPGAAIERTVPPGTPIVISDDVYFPEKVHYAGSRAGDFFYVLDWPTASDPRNRAEASVGFKMMQTWRTYGFLRSNIVPGDDFLCAHPRMVIEVYPENFWYDARIKSNPAFTSQMLSDSLHLMLVERNPGVTLSGCSSDRSPGLSAASGISGD